MDRSADLAQLVSPSAAADIAFELEARPAAKNADKVSESNAVHDMTGLDEGSKALVAVGAVSQTVGIEVVAKALAEHTCAQAILTRH